LILTTTAYCQQQGIGFNFYGGGARSEGMGQAYIALSDDGAAGGWNPAGLYVHEKLLMGFSYSSLSPHGYNKYYASPDRIFLFDHSGNIGAINNWSIISPARIKNHHVVFNFSLTRNLDSYYDFREKLYAWSDVDNTTDLDNNDPNTYMQRKGGISSVNIGFGTRIYKEFSIGAAANIYTGRIVTDEMRTLFLDSTIYADVRALADINIRSLDSSTYSGFNVTLGLQYTGEKFRSGLMLRTPFVMHASSDSTLTRTCIVNGIPFNSQGSIFSSDTAYIDNMTSRIEMPMMLGLGAAYDISSNWLVSADLEFRAFEGSKVENLDSLILTATGDRDEYFSASDSVPNWSNVIQFRIGTEYLFNTKYGEIPVRFGLRNEAFPDGNIIGYSISYEGEKEAGGAQISDEYSLVNNERVYYNFKYDTQKMTGFSASFGTGIHWSQILLDFAFTYTTYKQDVYNEDVLKSSNKWKNYHFNFGFTGYF